jgi:NAD(P)-dependent dehydrogenase (short-subunit alcohol dehydrogenase family)
MTHLANKTIWITGASSGIGEALAKLAAQRGAKAGAVVAARNRTRARTPACPRPHDVAVLPVDLPISTTRGAWRAGRAATSAPSTCW